MKFNHDSCREDPFTASRSWPRGGHEEKWQSRSDKVKTPLVSQDTNTGSRANRHSRKHSEDSLETTQSQKALRYTKIYIYTCRYKYLNFSLPDSTRIELGISGAENYHLRPPVCEWKTIKRTAFFGWKLEAPRLVALQSFQLSNRLSKSWYSNLRIRRLQRHGGLLFPWNRAGISWQTQFARVDTGTHVRIYETISKHRFWREHKGTRFGVPFPQSSMLETDLFDCDGNFWRHEFHEKSAFGDPRFQ